MVSNLSDRLQSALADRYLIERELGRGGTAIVYPLGNHAPDYTVALCWYSQKIGTHRER